MAFTRPTLGQLIKTAESEINALIDGADARLRFSVLNVFARVWAALTDGLYGALVFLSRQLFATTAEGIYLERIAETYGVARLAASPARGCVVVRGTAGTLIAKGTIFQRNDGLLFESTEDTTISAAGYVNVTVVSQVSGALANTTNGESVTASQTQSGVISVSVCDSGITGGADEETDAALRERLLFRLQNPPGAGTAADWERWAREYSPSVTRVWVIPQVNGNGTVGVVFAQDDSTIIPSDAELQAMRDHLAQYTPMGAVLYVYPPTIKLVDFSIRLWPQGSADVQTAVRAELDDLMFRMSGPGKTIGLSNISESISLAPGETDHQLLAPTDRITFESVAPVFEVGAVGTITWA